MTLSRLKRIDNLFKEAEFIENIKSEIGLEDSINESVSEFENEIDTMHNEDFGITAI